MSVRFRRSVRFYCDLTAHPQSLNEFLFSLAALTQRPQRALLRSLRSLDVTSALISVYTMIHKVSSAL